MRETLSKIAWRLPHDVRRQAYRLANPAKFQYLQNLKASESMKSTIKKKCLFVHIPKAAGISVAKSLFDTTAGSHTSIRHYQIMFKQEEYRKFFTFTFVRNPWDRLVSAYFFLKNGGISRSDALWAEKNMTGYTNFNAFVTDLRNKREIVRSTHFIPQHEFICGDGHNIEVDFIGRFERINRDFVHICNKLDMTAELMYANRTQGRRDYRHYYTDETAEITGKIYEKDIKLLGYEFES